MALTMKEKIQMDAIKNKEDYKIEEYEDVVLLTNGMYGVYIYVWELLIDERKYDKSERLKELDPLELEEKEENAKVIKEAITFGKHTANAVINLKKKKVWIWQECLKKFGGKVFYGMVELENGNEIITVRDRETGEIIGVIATLEDMEIQKNEVYQI